MEPPLSVAMWFVNATTSPGSTVTVEAAIQEIVQAKTPATPQKDILLCIFYPPVIVIGCGRWIRTTEGASQQIYSLPSLTA